MNREMIAVVVQHEYILLDCWLNASSLLYTGLLRIDLIWCGGGFSIGISLAWLLTILLKGYARHSERLEVLNRLKSLSWAHTDQVIPILLIGLTMHYCPVNFLLQLFNFRLILHLKPWWYSSIISHHRLTLYYYLSASFSSYNCKTIFFSHVWYTFTGN